MSIAKMLKRWLCAVIVAGGSLAPGARVVSAAPPTTLDAVKARGYINCGVGENSPGFSLVDSNGRWSGIEVEFCSALAAAVFGNKSSVKFRALPTSDRFKALQEGEIDVLLRATSWTLSRDSDLGARFTSVLFYDGQGFLVPRSHAVSSVLELSGASICVLPKGSGERAVAEYFTRTKMRYQLITSQRWEDLVQAYASGGCTVLTGDVSLLAYERSKLSSPADDWMAEIYERWTAAHAVIIFTPVYWYQTPGVLKLMIDRLVCADGGNPDPTTTRGKDAELAKALELAGCDYPKHLAGRAYGLVVHGDVAGIEGVRRGLSDWLDWMGLIDAGALSRLDRFIGYYKSYAESHAALDVDTQVQEEVRNVARAVANAVEKLRAGDLAAADAGLRPPRPK